MKLRFSIYKEIIELLAVTLKQLERAGTNAKDSFLAHMSSDAKLYRI